MDEWFIQRGGREVGPLSHGRLVELIGLGRLSRDDLVRTEGQPPRRAEDVPGLVFPERTPAAPDPGARPERVKAKGNGLSWATGTLVIVLAAAFGVIRSLPRGGDAGGLGQANVPVRITVPKGEMPTDEECRRWADELIRSATTGSPDESTLIDFASIYERSAEGLRLPDRAKGEFVSGLKARGFLKSIRPNFGDDFGMRVLQVRVVGDEKRVLVRVLGNSLNYLDLIVERGADGRVLAKDLYSYVTGERMTQSVRAVLLPITAQMNRDLLARLQGRENLFVKHIAEVRSLQAAAEQGRPAEALAIYARLPPEVREFKHVQLQRYRAAMNAQEGDELLATLDDIRHVLGDRPELELIYLDGHILRGDHPQIVRACGQLYEATRDPYLKAIEANSRAAMNETERALELTREATAEEPDFPMFWWNRLTIEAQAGRFDDAVATLGEIRTRFPEGDMDAALGTLSVPEFFESDAYRQWKTGERPKPAGDGE